MTPTEYIDSDLNLIVTWDGDEWLVWRFIGEHTWEAPLPYAIHSGRLHSDTAATVELSAATIYWLGETLTNQMRSDGIEIIDGLPTTEGEHV